MKILQVVIALTGAAGLAIAAPAHATTTTIDYTFGGAGSGSMVLDFDGTTYTLDSLNLTLGSATFNAATADLVSCGPHPYVLTATAFLCGAQTNSDTFFAVFDPSLDSQTASAFTWANDGGAINSGGTLTITQGDGAVPEPTTWAMMLVGLGGMGLAMRRRKWGEVTAS